MGRWISAIVPVKDPESGEVIAVFGVDYSASEWYARLREHDPRSGNSNKPPHAIFCPASLLEPEFHTERSKQKTALNEALYRGVFDQAPIGIAIVNDKSFATRPEYIQMNINPMFERIIGWKSSELTDIVWTEITHPDDLPPM